MTSKVYTEEQPDSFLNESKRFYLYFY